MLSRLAPALFFLSGLAGLLLQVAWFRLLAQSLGGSLAATTAVLSAFMAGLAAGAWWMAGRARRLSSGLRTYGFLEAGAGAAALLTLPLLQALDRLYGAFGAALPPTIGLGAKLLLAAAVLVPATFCMGGTLPALCQALAAKPETAGTRTGLLYALNTWGAVAGTLLALFWALPLLGLSGTVTAAALIDLAVAGAVLALGRREVPTAPPKTLEPERPGEGPARLGLFSLLLFGVGLAGLGYEVLWTRILAFYFGSGAHAFGVTLAIVLTGLALGGFVGGRLADRSRRPALVFAGSQALLALVIGYQLLRFPAVPDLLLFFAKWFPGGVDFTRLVIVLLLAAAVILLPAAVLMGVALPAAVRTVIRHEGESGRVVGRLVGANTLGTIPGAILAAWLLIPLFGTQGALVALAVLNALVAAAALVFALEEGGRRLALLPAALAVLLVGVQLFVVHPQRVYQGTDFFARERGEDSAQELLLLKESSHGTVSLTRITDSRGTWLSLSVDAVNVAGTSPPLLSCQVLQGQLPLLLHPDPKRVLHVGFGSGGTAAAVLTHPSVELLEVAEINPVIPEVSMREFRDVNGGVLDDPRAQVRFVDGRNWVLSTKEKYDVILSDSIHPRYSGNANLYTVDYFRKCRERLAPGGLVSTWLPIYSLSPDSLRSIVKSMAAAFPHASLWYLNSTVNEFVVLIGRTEGPGYDVGRIAEAMVIPSVRESLASVGLHSPQAVLDFHVAQDEQLLALTGDVPLHEDDLPWVEFESAAVLDRAGSWRVNFAQVVNARASVIPFLRDAPPGFAEDMERWEAATTVQLQGQRAFLRGNMAAASAAFDEALRLNPEDREPWEYFGPPPWVRERLAAAGERSPH